MHKLLYALLLSFPFGASAMYEITAVQAPSSLGDVCVYRHENGFSVVQDGYLQHVPNHNVDTLLTKIKPELLPNLGKIGYIKVNRLSDGEFKLDLKGRINGGGPVTAWWMYGVAKAFCWTTVGITTGAAVAGVVTATGGGAVLAAGAGAAAGKTVVGVTTAGMALSTTVPAAGVAAATVAAAGTTNAALAVTAASSGIGVVAAVETVSLGWAALFLGPWCP